MPHPVEEPGPVGPQGVQAVHGGQDGGQEAQHDAPVPQDLPSDVHRPRRRDGGGQRGERLDRGPPGVPLPARAVPGTQGHGKEDQ